VLTTHPHYPEWKTRKGYGQWSRAERINGVDVIRLKHYVPSSPKSLPRALSEASFGLRTAFRRWRHPDAIIVVSPALIASLIGAMRASLTHRKTPLVVWVQDLYTLGMVETGQSKGLSVRVISKIEGWLLRRATRVVVIHERFAARVADDFEVSRDRIEVIRNWTHLPPAPPIDVHATRESLGWAPGEIIVLHAGNMGVKQGLTNVVEAARLAATSKVPVKFVLLGHGSDHERLLGLTAGLATVQFLAPLNDELFAAALASADCLLVNELPGVSEMAVPSKLTSYFSAGRPVIAATDTAGITAEEIRAANAGVVVPAGDPMALLNAVIALTADHALCESLGENGRLYRRTVLDQESAINSFAEMLTRVMRAGDRGTIGGPDMTTPPTKP
jgi:glycosyltransferase involved in cell wall biosynthesis